MSECAVDCKMEDRIKQLEESSKHNSQQHRLFFEKFDSAALSNQKHDINIANISSKLDKIDQALEEMKSRPEKAIDKFSGSIISAFGSMVGTGIVGLIMYYAMQIP